MIISQNNITMPLIATSVNLQTEQVAKDNRIRPPVEPMAATSKLKSNKHISQDDKHNKDGAWELSEHPSYDLSLEQKLKSDPDEKNKKKDDNFIDHFFKLLSLNTYDENQGKNYAIRFRLPKHILNAALASHGIMYQRRKIINYHYDNSITPNIPTQTLAIL